MYLLAGLSDLDASDNPGDHGQRGQGGDGDVECAFENFPVNLHSDLLFRFVPKREAPCSRSGIYVILLARTEPWGRIINMLQQLSHAFAALQQDAFSSNHRRKFGNNFLARKYLGL